MRVGGQIVRPGAVIPGWVEIEGSTIIEVVADGKAGSGRAGNDQAGGDIIVPGFVDLHCHGGGGHTFTTGDPAAARKAAAFHLAHGTTTMLASLVSSPFKLMRDATAAFRPLVDEGVLAGVHFEGPYLSAARCGAQNPDHLRDPSIDELAELIALGGVRMVTIAPELAGAPEAIAFLRRHGVVAAVGHTDATYEQTAAGLAAGATVGTHVFNGMRPPHHREPGPVIGLLSSRAVCELIADNVHLHPGTLAFAARTAGPDRTALVTDAMDAAGMPDGEFELGGQAVEVSGRVARLARNGSIAGSTLTMDEALRNAVAAGIPLPEAATMASATPARVLGVDRALEAGLRADLVVLDAALSVKRVMRAGAWV